MPIAQPQFVKSFSERLRLARLLRQVSHLTLGRRVGIPRRTILRYEDGTIMPTLVTLVRLARALDVTTDYLLGLVDFPFSGETAERDSEGLDSGREFARGRFRAGGKRG